MRRTVPVPLIILIVAFMSGSCGGGSGSSNMNGPSSTSATTIDIVASSGLSNLGSGSFSPNPASAGQGTMLVWRNADSTTHRIVLNDGSLDTGDIAPGSSSGAKVLNVSSAQYHCTIHPSMVGSINTATTSGTSTGSGGYLRP